MDQPTVGDRQLHAVHSAGCSWPLQPVDDKLVRQCYRFVYQVSVDRYIACASSTLLLRECTSSHTPKLF